MHKAWKIGVELRVSSQFEQIYLATAFLKNEKGRPKSAFGAGRASVKAPARER